MTVTVKTKPPVAVLDAALRRAGFKHGESIEFKVSRKKVTIVPSADDDDTTLTPEEAKKVRHAMKQVRQGKTKPWSQVKHELGL
ncbi:MAG: hypothetical protein ACLQU1_14160 [Bryobacteraceae bacterium]